MSDQVARFGMTLQRRRHSSRCTVAWYLHGQCKRGDKCKFTHDENEKELLRIEKELAIMMKKEAQEKLDQMTTTSRSR